MKRIEDLDMNPHTVMPTLFLTKLPHLVFDKVAQNIPWRRNSLILKCCWEKWFPACRK
jgi:hypothetical protein